VSPTPSTASAMGALPVSAATRLARSGPSIQYDVAADRLDFGDDIVAPHHIDGLEAQRFRDRDQRPPDAGIALFWITQDPDAG